VRTTLLHKSGFIGLQLSEGKHRKVLISAADYSSWTASAGPPGVANRQLLMLVAARREK
jgi:hypothetical protein